MPKHKENDVTHFSIFLWIQMARDDLSVAKIETVSSFIRCYHAQQAMEKMLKASFVVVAGKFHHNSKMLIEEKEKKSGNATSRYEPNCAWELEEGIKFPKIHDIVALWEHLRCYDKNAFLPLAAKQEDFMNKASKCATDYRYPYFLPKNNSQVCFIPEDDVKAMVEAAEQLYGDLYNYISNKCQSHNN